MPLQGGGLDTKSGLINLSELIPETVTNVWSSDSEFDYINTSGGTLEPGTEVSYSTESDWETTN